MQGRYNILFCWNPNSQLWSLNRTHPLTGCNLRPRNPPLKAWNRRRDQARDWIDPSSGTISPAVCPPSASHHIASRATIWELGASWTLNSAALLTPLLKSTTTDKDAHLLRASVAIIVWIPTWLPTNQVFLLSRPPSRQAHSVTSKLRLSQAGKSKIFSHILTFCPPAPNPIFFGQPPFSMIWLNRKLHPYALPSGLPFRFGFSFIWPQAHYWTIR